MKIIELEDDRDILGYPFHLTYKGESYMCIDMLIKQLELRIKELTYENAELTKKVEAISIVKDMLLNR